MIIFEEEKSYQFFISFIFVWPERKKKVLNKLCRCIIDFSYVLFYFSFLFFSFFLFANGSSKIKSKYVIPINNNGYFILFSYDISYIKFKY